MEFDERLHDLVERHARANPDARAVSLGGAALTYRELDQYSNQLAHSLRRAGVATNTPVGICFERSLELVIAILGVLKAGGAYVPIDAEHPAHRMHMILSDSGTRWVLCHDRLSSRLRAANVTPWALELEKSGLAGFQHERSDPPAPVGDSKSWAYVIYTSGSTGNPKGVVVSHRAISNHMRWMRRSFPLEAHDRVLQKTSIGFDASIWEFFLPLQSGCELVLAPPQAHRDLAALCRVIKEEKITVFQAVPSLFELLLRIPLFADCASLRRLFSGGEALNMAIHDVLLRTFSAELVNLYGPTEASIDATFWPCVRGFSGDRVPIGSVISGMCAEVIEIGGEGFKRVEDGEVGELYLGGEGLAEGYLGRPDLTDERFVTFPCGDRVRRMFRTGDQVRRRPDGALEYIGRLDHQIKHRGIRMEPEEIECALLSHPDVAAAFVRVEGQGLESKLAGYVVPRGPKPPSILSLRQHCATRLPRTMIVDEIRYVEALPRLPNGKLDRKARYEGEFHV